MDSHEILSSLSPQIMLSPTGGAESKKQQALERKSSYKLNANSVFGTFSASHSHLLCAVCWSSAHSAVTAQLFAGLD